MSSSAPTLPKIADDHTKTLGSPLLTVGQIADRLGVPFHQVGYILRSRRGIKPTMRVGTFRLYDAAAVAAIEHELEAIATRRGGPTQRQPNPQDQPP